MTDNSFGGRVGGFVAFEILVITVALLQRRSELQKQAAPALRGGIA